MSHKAANIFKYSMLWLKREGILTKDIPSFDIEIRAYSKSYWGKYYPKSPTKERAIIAMYPFVDAMHSDVYSHDTLIEQFLHEVSHHMHYTSKGFVKRRGEAHPPEFWKIYNHLLLISKGKIVEYVERRL